MIQNLCDSLFLMKKVRPVRLKRFRSHDLGIYSVSDKFFAMWLLQQ